VRRTLFPPTEDDLSHTGEYHKENVPPEDNMPTNEQTHQKATYEGLPLDPHARQVSRFRDMFSAYPDSDGYSSDDGCSAGSKRSLNNEPRASPPLKKRRPSIQSLHIGEAYDQEEDLQSEGIDTGGNTSPTVDQSTASESSVPPENDFCHHQRFFKDDGMSSHGLWPHCAMICECRQKIIQARGTGMPSIGRGSPSQL